MKRHTSSSLKELKIYDSTSESNNSSLWWTISLMLTLLVSRKNSVWQHSTSSQWPTSSACSSGLIKHQCWRISSTRSSKRLKETERTSGKTTKRSGKEKNGSRHSQGKGVSLINISHYNQQIHVSLHLSNILAYFIAIRRGDREKFQRTSEFNSGWLNAECNGETCFDCWGLFILEGEVHS